MSESRAVGVVTLTDVTKSFGPTRALRSVSMDVRSDTVHALVGQNGAGKSTALGIVAGRIAPTSGRVEVLGRELTYGDPRSSRNAGVAAIYQELTIIPSLSAEANVFLGQNLSRAGILAERQMRSRYLEICEEVGIPPIPPGTQARELSVAEQQMLEILRALVSGGRVLLFDEPTAALSVRERKSLYALINKLKEDGVAVVFVSHNLDEVLDLADDITVFRDGEVVGSAPRADFTKASLVSAMLGAEGAGKVILRLAHAMAGSGDVSTSTVESHPNAPAEGLSDVKVSRRTVREREPLLVASGVTVPGVIENLEVEVSAGEMVGIGGLVGSGRTTFLRALCGLEPSSKGRLWIDGHEVKWPRNVKQALRYGIALVPEERKTQGLVLSMSATENIAISDFSRAARFGLLSDKSISRATSDIGMAFGVPANRLGHRASELSGGNQQKLLLARWKYFQPRILLADEPTRGVDVGARAEILRSLELMADVGVGFIVVSSDLEEVAALADRVYVFAYGQMAGVIDNADGEVTDETILQLAFGTTSEVPIGVTPSATDFPAPRSKFTSH
jgi:ABC-type sugar transport system ATPase subunit